MTLILVVEANKRDRDVIREAANKALADRVDIRSLTDGADAIRRAAGDEPFDLAVVDWGITGSASGAAVVQAIRRNRQIPVIATTDTCDLSRVKRAMDAGATDVIQKPLSVAEVARGISAALTDREEPALLGKLRNLEIDGTKLAGESEVFIDTLRRLARVIESVSRGKRAVGHQILIRGENGTGKEALAKAVHLLGSSPDAPFVPQNVATLGAVAESTLFGHEKGAFSDAHTSHEGLFEQCGQGTLFLDEIGEAAPDIQEKLLRVIQSRRFTRVGGEAELPFEGQLVCATNKDLESAVADGSFREDLYHRITTHTVTAPSLRSRGDDKWLLVDHFLNVFGGDRKIRLGRNVRSVFAGYQFRGNIRELRNIISDAIVNCHGDEIRIPDIPIDEMEARQAAFDAQVEHHEKGWPEALFTMPLPDAEDAVLIPFLKEYIPKVIERAQGQTTKAAKLAGVDVKTFNARRRKAGLM